MKPLIVVYGFAVATILVNAPRPALHAPLYSALVLGTPLPHVATRSTPTTSRSVVRGRPPSPTASPVPPLQQVTSAADDWQKAITAVLKLLTVAVLGLWGIWLAGRILIKYMVLRRRELVVADLSNLSGIAELDGMVGGFSQQAREMLVDELEQVHVRIVRYTRIFGPGTAPPGSPAPAKMPDQALTELTNSLTAVASDNIKWVIPIIRFALPPLGTMVTGSLQRRGEEPDRLGITFEVTDLRGKQERKLCTFWESLPSGLILRVSRKDAASLTLTSSDKTIAPASHNHVWRYAHRWPASLLARVSIPASKMRANHPTPQVHSSAMPNAQGKVTEHDAEAAAYFALGQLYAAQGALVQAKTQFENALHKEPAYEDARDALKQVLDTPWTQSQRYTAVLRPSVRWLALELSRREMIARIPLVHRWFGRRKTYLAQVYNFFGSFYQTSGITYGSFFYKLAVAEFERAIELRADWFQPHKNLAQTYSYMGHLEQNQDDRLLQARALFHYAKAIELIDRTRPDRDEAAWKTTVNRVRVNRAITQLLTQDADIIEDAKRRITAIEATIPAAEIRDAGLLYDLAQWFALADRFSDVAQVACAKARARRYLAYALARAPDGAYWSWASWDKDLESVQDGLDVLEFELLNKLAEVRGLPDLNGAAFADAVDSVLAKANWQ